MTSRHDLVRKACATFEGRWGAPPRWRALAPGRVNLIGDHTDYNDGFVLPMALEQATVVVGAPGGQPGAGRRVRAWSAQLQAEAVIDLEHPLEPGEPHWANYVRGVLDGFATRGLQGPSLDLVIDSDVPAGAGLSSSAALEVALATLLEAATGHALDPMEKALLCQRAEHAFAGVPCGFMDQFASVLGREDHFLLIDCRSRAVEPVPMREAGLSLLVADTNLAHRLEDGQYARRRQECEEAARRLGVRSLREVSLEQVIHGESALAPLLARRARHVVTESARTQRAAQALRQGEWELLGRLMGESHASLRDDFEVSCAELDSLVDIAHSGRGT
ncbi:MAG: galactokinase, partial [Deltaproteobacteria bacterium]|nr:galactokinase [Deltaproteobacteria bacterium]